VNAHPEDARKGCEMSIDLMQWAFDLRGLGSAEKIVLMRLCYYARRDNHTVQISQRRLAEDCEICEHTARLLINKLCDRGYLKSEDITGGWYARKRYTILYPAVATLTSSKKQVCA